MKMILKDGATDLRRNEKALTAIVEEKMGMNAHDGTVYGFANTYCTLIKILKYDGDGVILWKRRLHDPVEWPEYNRSFVTLIDEAAIEFLRKIGCPADI